MALSFSKPMKHKKDDNNTYTFNLHTKNHIIGEVWLRVVGESKTNLNMQMWATNINTYKNARTGIEKLNKLLNDAGLTISSFEIFNEQKPGVYPEQNDKCLIKENIISGSTVDIEA